MSRRFAKVSVFAGLVLVFSGCVETTQIITLNPDGKGKVEYDVLMAAGLNLDAAFAGGGAPKEKSPDEMRQDAAINVLTKSKGIKAWKDVSAKWEKDGRLRLKATAYFDSLDDLGSGGTNEGGLFAVTTFSTAINKGVLNITSKKADQKEIPKQAQPDVSKMNDRELDEHILKQRIGFQTMKPIMIMMFTDLKVKTVFRLPGEIQDSKGFKIEKGEAVHLLDGNDILQIFKKFMTQDDAIIKKLVKSGNPDMLAAFGVTPELMEPSLSVQKLRRAQFDYAKEVQAAVDAYPQLRQMLKMEANVKLPGEK